MGDRGYTFDRMDPAAGSFAGSSTDIREKAETALVSFF